MCAGFIVIYKKIHIFYSACNCNPDGTVDEGLCDPPTLPHHYEGVCHCKQNVWGNRCNECKPGYWNLDPNNPLGCQRQCFIMIYSCDPLL